jgi:hypothetical protein
MCVFWYASSMPLGLLPCRYEVRFDRLIFGPLSNDGDVSVHHAGKNSIIDQPTSDAQAIHLQGPLFSAAHMDSSEKMLHAQHYAGGVGVKTRSSLSSGKCYSAVGLPTRHTTLSENIMGQSAQRTGKDA